MKYWTPINSLRSGTIQAMIFVDTLKSWFETGNWILKVISIILLFSYLYNDSVTNPNYKLRPLLKKWTDAISAKLKSLPALNKWTYFDWFMFVVMGLNIYFVWSQTEDNGFRVLSIAMVVAYVLLRTIEILTTDKN